MAGTRVDQATRALRRPAREGPLDGARTASDLSERPVAPNRARLELFVDRGARDVAAAVAVECSRLGERTDLGQNVIHATAVDEPQDLTAPELDVLLEESVDGAGLLAPGAGPSGVVVEGQAVAITAPREVGEAPAAS